MLLNQRDSATNGPTTKYAAVAQVKKQISNIKEGNLHTSPVNCIRNFLEVVRILNNLMEKCCARRIFCIGQKLDLGSST